MPFPLSPSDIHEIWLNLLASTLWVAGGFILSSVIGFYIRDRGTFAGRWSMTINWNSSYAERLFGGHVKTPHSVGQIALTYAVGAHKNGYWGIGYFELRAATQQYAKLCVKFDNVMTGYKIFNTRIPFLFTRELKSFDLYSLLREQTREFEYGPWVQYRMVFDTSCRDKLMGRMILLDTRECVGTIVATRTT